MILLKNMKFWLLAAVAIGFSILILVVRSLFQKPSTSEKPETPGFGGLPPAPAAVQDAAEKAHEEALTAKAASQAVTDEKKKQLSEIGNMPDRKARREALAAFIQS